jgi:2-succinyl-5-enolpyruvyl-6-hydroxy-3-cyclohexene-1-carboxylate synthase
MKAPVYCEAASGLREEARLKHLQIRVESAVWKLAKTNGYEIDGILRIGGVPVTRIWRDLEDRVGQLVECSLSEVPLSGLSWGTHIQAHLDKVLSRFQIPLEWKCADFNLWMQADVEREKQIQGFFDRFPTSEPALYRSLSQQISPNSLVYLGNSLPVREWDLTAILESRQIEIQMNRGLNGIDGQLSTFLGLCQKGRENWAILGDLTTLYDFPALWILASLNEIPIKIVVMNNGGGKLFARIYTDPIFQHLHNFDFEYFAKSWRVPYLLTSSLNEADMKELPLQAFVEVCPDPQQTELFWKAYDELR